MNSTMHQELCRSDSIWSTRFGSVWRLPLAAVMLMAMLLAGLHMVQAASVGEGFKVTGTVSSAPNSVDGTGLWGVVDDMGHAHSVQADANTEFDNGVPQIGDRVEVLAETGGPQPLATDIKKLDDGGGDDDPGKVEVKGTVVQRPLASNGIGAWLIQTQLYLTQTVIADASTRFDEGVPELGAWVEAEGPRQPDGTIQATRIRPDDYEDGELVVWLTSSDVVTEVEILHDVEVKSSLLASANIYLFETDDDYEKGIINKLNADKERVIYAELNYVQGVPEEDGYSTWGWGGVDPEGYTNQYAFEQVNLNGAQGRFDGSGTVVAVLDTGVALTHTMLITRLLPGLDVVADDAIPEDEPAGLAWGHGTHVAGIIAHIAPDSRILPVRVLDSNGRGNTFLLAYAIDWAIDKGVDVINLSLGADADSRILKDKIEEALARGIVVIAAAGNDNLDTVRYPAGYAGVIAVSAVDHNSLKADFSNYGDWIDLSAPGVGITSTVVGPLGQGFASWSGTSMAAPFVSGATALVQEANPEMSTDDLVARLTSAAADLSSTNPDYVAELGGLLDIGAAVGERIMYLPSLRN